jgi:hypothetical protein
MKIKARTSIKDEEIWWMSEKSVCANCENLREFVRFWILIWKNDCSPLSILLGLGFYSSS